MRSELCDCDYFICKICGYKYPIIQLCEYYFKDKNEYYDVCPNCLNKLREKEKGLMAE